MKKILVLNFIIICILSGCSKSNITTVPLNENIYFELANVETDVKTSIIRKEEDKITDKRFFSYDCDIILDENTIENFKFNIKDFNTFLLDSPEKKELLGLELKLLIAAKDGDTPKLPSIEKTKIIIPKELNLDNKKLEIVIRKILLKKGYTNVKEVKIEKMALFVH